MHRIINMYGYENKSLVFCSLLIPAKNGFVMRFTATSTKHELHNFPYLFVRIIPK